MMTFKTFALSVAAALALGACVTATPYQPAAGGVNSYGFDDTRIEPGKYRVSFRGNTATERTTVENYILLRAAELTIADGLGHFLVLEEDDSGTSDFRTSGFNSGIGTGFGFGRRSFGGFGGTTSARTRERLSPDVSVLIQAFPGEKSEDNYQAFNAAAVIENLGPVAQSAQ